jgi:hypothetical protein
MYAIFLSSSVDDTNTTGTPDQDIFFSLLSTTIFPNTKQTT